MKNKALKAMALLALFTFSITVSAATRLTQEKKADKNETKIDRRLIKVPSMG